jgi:capsular exopolysaccharide synthesis family protein
MDSSKVQPAPETKLHFLDYWRIIRIRKTVILAVFLLVVFTATLVTWFLPESYSSTARIKVEREQSDITSFFGQSAGGYDPYFIQTEFEVIQSEVIMGKVIRELKLDSEWGKKWNGGQPFTLTETTAMLKRMMDLRPVRNTSLIEIRVFSEKPEEAEKIANKIAEAYQSHRKEEARRFREGGIEALLKRLEEAQARVTEAQTNVDYLRIKLEVPEAIASESQATVSLSFQKLSKIESLRVDCESEYTRQSTVLAGLKSMTQEQLAQSLLTAGIPDQLLSGYLEALTMAEQQLVSLTKEYGMEHTKVLQVSAQAADMKQKIKTRVDGILSGLDTRVEALRKQLAVLQEAIDTAKKADIDQAARTQPYFAAKRDLDEKSRFRNMLQTKIEMERTDLELPKNSMVEIVDPARAGLRPVRPNKPLNIALGVVIGLVVGVGLAFFIEYLDTSVKTIDDVERTLGAPVLGVIPQNVGLLIEEGAESPHAEAYRVLRTNLLFSRKDDKLNTVAVVSAGAGEGKSTTVFNLASVFAQSGQRVLIVDSDLRRPTLHKMLRVTNNIGLTNYLLKQNRLEEVIQTTNLPTLDFMASGKLPSSSLGILSSSQMRDLITELKQHYDFIFFDSPPVMGVSDASILASEVDMTIQVIQYRRYPQPMNIRAKQMIEKVGGNLAGIVLNNINMSQDESYYYYSGYYHDYYSRNDEQDSASPTKGDGKPNEKLEIKQKY